MVKVIARSKPETAWRPVLSIAVAMVLVGHGCGSESDEPLCEGGEAESTSWVRVFAGNYETCVVSASGSVRCWGSNVDGEVGNGMNNNRESVPVAPEGLTCGIDMAMGAGYACATLFSGELACWGADDGGQLGEGEDARLVPMRVTDVEGVVDVDTSPGTLTGVVLAGGGVRVWGSAGSYEPPVGLGGTIPLSGPARELAVGTTHACALMFDGTVSCWGDNRCGQLGNGTRDSSDFPVSVADLSDVVEVDAAPEQTCARRVGGEVYCWGEAISAEHDFATRVCSTTPVLVAIPPAMRVDMSVLHACAGLTDGTVRCWGSGRSGQLGDGAGLASTTPVAVEGVAGVIDVAVGTTHSCALLGNGEVWCWGSNGYGELGDGTFGDRDLAAPVVW